MEKKLMNQLNKYQNEMKQILEAAEVSINLFNEIEAHKMHEENRVKHNALGQVLRSLKEKVLLENERPNDSQPAT